MYQSTMTHLIIEEKSTKANYQVQSCDLLGVLNLLLVVPQLHLELLAEVLKPWSVKVKWVTTFLQRELVGIQLKLAQYCVA